MERSKTRIPFILLSIHELDVNLFLWLTKRKHLVLWARLCRYLSHTADGYGYPVLGLLLWLWGGTSGRLLAITLILAFSMERPLYLLLKKGLKRNRPADALADYNSFITPSDRFSFPSGHTSGAFAVATAVGVFFPDAAPLAYVWACLVGVARVTLGVHFPTDTLAGALMGSLVTLFSAFWITQ